MPEQDPQPPVIDYHHPPPRRSWLASLTGWDWTLLITLAVMAFIWRHPEVLIIGRHGPGTRVVLWMFLLIGLRSAWGVFRRDRSFWWIPYLLLALALLPLTNAVTRFYWTPLGDRLATTMYHFWRDL